MEMLSTFVCTAHWMSCSLKNHVNLSSSDGSWLTWQGSTTLSPTVMSSVDGRVVMAALQFSTGKCDGKKRRRKKKTAKPFHHSYGCVRLS
ncbi:hypothetical protein EYF80_011195 [Liparis tanakae]|uniref:Uncharacterized protein n=1 Tax=Liparis tanakae TaxID=230148 RepID=A0A4Z2IKN2_9TELE|nr:hypothetical protein EYF80_011195 [Liparis tanakae]